MKTDTVVIGGGLYGCKVALSLRSLGLSVILLEPNQLLSGATSANQGRVHGGYHYPRSHTTALAAQKYYRRFLADHAPAIDANYRHLYVIADGSKTSPAEFEAACNSVGARLGKIAVPAMFEYHTIQAAYEVDEVTFNMDKLAVFIKQQLQAAGVTHWHVRGGILSIQENEVVIQAGGHRIHTGYVFNCTYGNIDTVVPIRTQLKKEHTEVALLQIEDKELADTDITVMDGPFWSLMKFPSEGCHALTHVTYTPHNEWYPHKDVEPLFPHISLAHKMLKDAERFVPCMSTARYIGSRYTTRVVLAKNEGDDGRPILWEYSEQSPRVISILGSKFNSIYDAVAKIEAGEWVKSRGATGVLTVGRRALVGYTGFIGSNLDIPGRFTDRYNSKNIEEMSGSYDLVVCAGAPGRKWYANANPEEDSTAICKLGAQLQKIEAKEFILISTIDVENGDKYAHHRAALERVVLEKFPHAKVIRFPSVYGRGFKKNVLWDLLNGHQDSVNPQSIYQWYPVDRMWWQIVTAPVGISTLVSEPVQVSEIINRLFSALTGVGVSCSPSVQYDIPGPYIMSKDEVIEDMRQFVGAECRKRLS